jgi:hypothetical protein
MSAENRDRSASFEALEDGAREKDEKWVPG